ncbi:hypothetical protein Mapa_005080 [Marchantia paleacea]|nr:hypothetical protein Mapa_005080 [Marchantia paleacea]
MAKSPGLAGGSLKSSRSRIEIPAPVSSAFCAPAKVRFVIEQKPFRKLNEKIYEIADSNGKRLFEADSLLFAGSRRLRDDKDQVLAHLKKKTVTMHERWEAHRGENSDELVFILKKESMFHKAAFNVFLASNISMQTPDFTIRGDFEEQTYSIRHNDMPVAEVSKTLYPYVDQLCVTVFPGVDQAFIAAILVVMDQIKDDDDKFGSGWVGCTCVPLDLGGLR